MDTHKYTLIEMIVLFITIQCFHTTYSIYFGGALAGKFGGLIFVFFGWIPAIIGFLLIPVNIFLIIMILKKWKGF